MAKFQINPILLSLFLVPLALSAEVKPSYDGYQVYTVILESEAQYSAIEGLVSDVWKEPTTLVNSRNRASVKLYTDIMIAPENLDEFKAIAEHHQLPVSIKVTDVGELIKSQETPVGIVGSRAVDFTDYYRYSEINAYLEEIVGKNSDIASIRTIARSTEGRDVKLVKISKEGSAPNKTAILVDGGFHAREWISPAIALYIVNELLANRNSTADVLDAVDFYIIPLVNPDGYEWSHTNSRLWRKTRSDHNSLLGCKGVDPNRNYDFQFGGPGTSADKCSDIYHGPTPFSEPEVAGVRDVLLDKSVNFAAYFTIHSYGLMWLTPWSYTYNLPSDYNDLMNFGRVGAQAIAALYGTTYRVGATTEVYGLTAGCADDWAKAVPGVKYATTIEVRDKGLYGFLLPKAQIIPTSEETWAGIRALAFYDY